MNKSISSYIDNLIRNNYTYTSDGYELDVNSLDEIDIDEFMLKLYNFSSEEENLDIWTFFIECDHSEAFKAIPKAFNLLINDFSTDEKMNFCDVIRDAMRKFYMPKMQALIDERIGNVEAEDNYDKGLRSGMHKDNGEIYWY